MENTVHVCRAERIDAGLISRILIRSIKEGCALDHRNNPQVVDAWVRNKTCNDIQSWLKDSRFYLNVVRLGDKPVGVGMARLGGQIALCYVEPQWFRRGAGQALVRDLEGWLGHQGCTWARLNSTRTSLNFYTRLGYQPCAQPFAIAGLVATPMFKALEESVVTLNPDEAGAFPEQENLRVGS